ncbi:MAG: SMC family ATPase, partial [Thermoplasmata archaeon]
MEIRRLRVRNIRSYASAELTFPSGTTFLSGDVGAGKTSLLQAIELALFGFAEVEAEHLVRHQAGEAEVALSFEGDDHPYEIVRRFRRVVRRGRTIFELERNSFAVDGATAQYSQTELRQRVIELLGFPDNPNPRIPSNLWRWAVYVPQERMREVLNQSPEDRRETIRRALGLDRYRTAAENAQLLAAELRKRAADLTRSAEALGEPDQRIAELDAKIPALRAAEAEQSERFSAAERRIRELADALQVRQEARGRLAADRREHTQIGQAVASTQRELAGLEEQLRRSTAQRSDLEGRLTSARRDVEVHRQAAAELPHLDAELQTIRRRQETIQESLRELASLRSQIEEMADRIQRTERERKAERSRLDEGQLRLARWDGPEAVPEPPGPEPMPSEAIEAQLAEARTVERECREREIRARQNLQELDALLAAGSCPRCGQPVRPEEFAGHRASTDDELRRCVRATQAAQAEVARLEAARTARVAYDRERARYVTFLAQREKDAQTVQLAAARVEELEREYHQLMARAGEAQRRCNELAPLEAEDQQVRRELGQVETRIATARRAFELAQRGEQEVARLTGAIEGLDGQTRIWRETAAARKEVLETSRRRLAELESALAEEPTVMRALESMARELEATRAQADQLREERVRTATQLTHATADREIAVSTARRQQEFRQIAARRRRTAEWVGGPMRDALLEMEATLLRQSELEFQHHFGRYFSALVEDPAIVARIDPGFTPHVLLNGVWTPPG